MKVKPVLYKLYHELPEGTQATLQKRFRQFILPTEVVLRNGVPTPRYARAYRDTGFYVPFGTNSVLTYEELVQGDPTFKGTATVSNNVWLLEYFEDQGDDGHTDMVLNGWIFVTDNLLSDDLYTNQNRWKPDSPWAKIFPKDW